VKLGEMFILQDLFPLFGHDLSWCVLFRF